MWRDVAEKGTYLFLEDTYSESEWFHINQKEYNIMKVEDNYITQIVNLRRSDKSDQFNINQVSTFNIIKGEVHTRKIKTWWGSEKIEKYRNLLVTENIQLYSNNKAEGKPIQKYAAGNNRPATGCNTCPGT